ncbi:hypothetical protein DITRI_Ditri12bG0085000 [Diplodiscus trichospermus]
MFEPSQRSSSTPIPQSSPTTRSGYKLLAEEDVTRTDKNAKPCPWMKIWRTNVPNKDESSIMADKSSCTTSDVESCKKKHPSEPNDKGLQYDQQADDDFLSTWERLETKELQEFMVTIWYIWTCRNNEVDEEERRLELEAANFVRNYMEEIRNSVEIRQLMPTQFATGWVSPQLGDYKANFDGATGVENKFDGIGLISRDENGGFVEAYSS